MQVTGKVVVVTGGGNGIGKAMCEAFHRAGAAKVVVADIDPGWRASRRHADRRRGLQMRCRKGEGYPSRHRGDRASIRPDCAVLLQCRHRRRLRSAVGECRRKLRRTVAAKLGRSCHGACLCGPPSDPAHEGARRRLFPQHDFGGGVAVAGRQPGLFDHQACRGRFCRESRDLAQGRQHQGFDPVPAGRRHQHAALDPEGPAIRRRRPVAGAGGAGRAEGTASRKPL